jgi:hypothetical protein
MNFIKKNIYILSSGRSGSNFLYEFLKEHYHHFNINHQKPFSRLLNILSNIPIHEGLKYKFIKYVFKYIRKEEYPQSTIDPLISMSLVYYINNNKNLSSDCKIVLLVREPRSFVASFMNWKSSNLKKKILHHIIPFWQPVGYFHNIGFFKWMKMKKYEKFAWVWAYKNRFFLKYAGNKNFKIFKIEETTSDPNKMYELISFIGLKKIDFDKEKLEIKKNKSNKNFFPLPKEWNVEMNESIIRLCGDLMAKLGYRF